MLLLGLLMNMDYVLWLQVQMEQSLVIVKLVSFLSFCKLDETEWKSQQISICKQGCSSLSWSPYRPASSDGINILRVAVGSGDNCIHILK